MRIERVQPGCNVATGHVVGALGTFVVGRAKDVDVSLDDATISRRHVEVRATDTGFVVRCLAQNGSTFVDEVAIGSGEEIEVASGRAWVQVGRVLLRVELAPRTIPVHDIIPVPDTGPARQMVTALVRIRRDKIPRIFLGGRELVMFPSAARVLTRLCETPGDVVDHDTLLTAVDPDHGARAGGANLAQLVTYVRDAFLEALDAGLVAAEDLRILIIASAPDLVTELAEDVDARALLRVLIPSRRGLGYAIRLPASAIGFE